jgi:hypothetical protein
MNEIQPALPYLAFVVGLAAGFGGALLLIPKSPCTKPPDDYHTVTIEWDPENEGQLVVKPMILPDVQQCDVVAFVNTTGQDATVDFGGSEESIGTPFNEMEEFTIKSDIEGGDYTQSPQVIVEAPEKDYIVYPYTVVVGETEQSPVIRIGPRKPSVSKN